jgi:virginiamycin B lyase
VRTRPWRGDFVRRTILNRARAALGTSVALLGMACTGLKSANDRATPPAANDGAIDATAADAASPSCPVITEFRLPATQGTSPVGIVAATDGTVWFTLEYTDGFVPGGAGSYGSGIGWLSLDGAPHEISVPTSSSGPSAMTLGPDHNPWFAEYESGKVAKVTIDGGPVVTEFPTPANGPNGISPGPNGTLWFTDLNGNGVDRIEADGGSAEEFAIVRPSSVPRGITLGPDGNLWFAEGVGAIGRITPKGDITEFPIDQYNPSVKAITVGPDNNLWFTDGGNNAIGRISPDGAMLVEYPIPTPGSSPLEIVAGPDGALWFTESAPLASKIGRVTIDGEFLECPTPTTLSSPNGITATSSAIWFAEADANQIARIVLDP